MKKRTNEEMICDGKVQKEFEKIQRRIRKRGKEWMVGYKKIHERIN